MKVNENDILDHFISVTKSDIEKLKKFFFKVKKLFCDVIPMYQSVIAANNGFAP